MDDLPGLTRGRHDGAGDLDRDEALKLLKSGHEGIAEWNRRRESGEEIPDLEQANLE